MSMVAGIENLSVGELDAVIAAALARRAALAPGPPALPPADTGRMQHFDDLLWEVRPAAGGGAVELMLFHPALGWCVVNLSRAQVEDLRNACLFALGELPVSEA